MQKSFVRYLAGSLILCAIFLNLKGYIINLNCMANFFVLTAVFMTLTKERTILPGIKI